MRRHENDLLLQCVRSYINPSESKFIEGVVSQDLDWEYVLQAAVKHRVMPLLYHSLHTLRPNGVPKPILDRLQKMFQSNARRNLFLSGELLKLLKLLETQGISAISFKGPVLSIYAYDNLSLRQYLDLDILVRKSDILRAKALLLSNGYRAWPGKTGEDKASHLEAKHAFVLVPESPTYSVDLHWTIARRHYSYSLGDEILWEHVELLPFGGRQIFTFRPEKMILVLAAHGSKHSWQQLGWICDIAQLVRSRPELDWQQVLREAQKAKCLRELFLALQLAKNLIAAPVPASTWQVATTYPGVRAATDRVTRQLFRGEQPLLLWRLNRLVFLFRLKQRARDALVFLWHELRLTMTLNSKDYNSAPLPVGFSFLYYIIRPIRLAVSYGLLPLIRAWPHSASSDYSWSEEKLRHSADRRASVEEKRDTNE